MNSRRHWRVIVNRLGAFAIATVSMVGVSCDKTQPAEKGGTPPTSEKAGPPGGGGGPVAVTAIALFAEHAAAGGLMPDLGHKYDAGALVTGTVGKVLTDLGTTFVSLDAGEKKSIALTFVDHGAEVRARGVKAGDTITVLCKLGGMGGDQQAILGDCKLK